MTKTKNKMKYKDYRNYTEYKKPLSSIDFTLACCISACLAQIILPLLSIDIAGSSLPNCIK